MKPDLCLLFKQISLKTVRDDLAGAEVTLNINHIILKKPKKIPKCLM